VSGGCPNEDGSSRTISILSIIRAGRLFGRWLLVGRFLARWILDSIWMGFDIGWTELDVRLI